MRHLCSLRVEVDNTHEGLTDRHRPPSFYKGGIEIKGRKSIFSSSDQQYIRDHYHTVPYKNIADTLGYTERQVRGWVNNHCAKKYRVFNESYFDKIDTGIKAYFLGYIYADGWVTHHTRSVVGEDNESPTYKYEFGMQLQYQDRTILELLNHELGDQHVIKDVQRVHYIPGNSKPSHTHSSVLRVYSKHLVQSLRLHNITSNKTYDDEYPEVDDIFFADFLRGYFDGDGCVYANRHGMAQVHFTAYNSQFLKYIQWRISTLYDIQASIYMENDHKFRLVVYQYESVRKLYSVLYQVRNEYMLERKYDKYTNLLGLAA